MSKRRSAKEVAGIVREFEASGLTRREYCHRRGIAVNTLDSWRRKRKRPALVQVEVQPTAQPADFRLILPNGRRIESGWHFADADLARLIRIAESA